MTAWEGGPPTSCFVLETSQAQSWSVVRRKEVRGGVGVGIPGCFRRGNGNAGQMRLHVAKMQVSF